MSAEDQIKAIHDAIFDGEVAETKILLNQALQAEIDAKQILQDAVLRSIQEIGESMEEGDFFMPEVKIATKALLEVAEIIRPQVLTTDEAAGFRAPPWTGEGDIDDIGTYLKDITGRSGDLSPAEQMGLLDMIAQGLNTHEFTPCKIQAKETDD